MKDDEPPRGYTPTQAEIDAEAKRREEDGKATKVQGYLRILRAVKKQGYWWPGED